MRFVSWYLSIEDGYGERFVTRLRSWLTREVGA